MTSSQPRTADVDDPVAAAMTQMAPDILNRLNADFEDSVLFIGRMLTGHRAATRARLTALDPRGVDLVVTDPDGDHARRIAFDSTITDPLLITSAVFALVDRARAESGETGQTSAEKAVAEMATIRTFVTEVVAVREVHAHLRSITFGGGDLAGFSPIGPDSFVYVLLPPPGRTELTIDQRFTWEAAAEMPEAERPVGAYYTVRDWRPDTAELEAHFVLHGDSGPAAAWAAVAKPGDPVALWGPRTAWEPPADTDWYLLVADDTGLPAVASILESLPQGTDIRVFAEVAGPEEHQQLRTTSTVDVTWLHRDGAEPGTTTLLADAVRAMPRRDGKPYVWGGGESHAMTAVRRYVRHEVGLPREYVSLVAYWRHTAHQHEGDALD